MNKTLPIRYTCRRREERDIGWSLTDERATCIQQVCGCWRRFACFGAARARGLAEMLPKGLYKRSLLIVIVPMVLLQTAVTLVFMQHHWDLVTRRLSEAVARDVGALTDLYQRLPPGEDDASLANLASERFRMDASLLPAGPLPPRHASLLLRRIGSAHADPSERDQEAGHTAFLDRHRRPLGAHGNTRRSWGPGAPPGDAPRSRL